MKMMAFSVAWRNDFGIIINGLTNGTEYISWVGHVGSGVGLSRTTSMDGQARYLFSSSFSVSHT
jgi:hypothetical protein